MIARGFHTITLGCKLNQFDSAGIEGELAHRGYRAVKDPRHAAVVVINTCTVTHRADADARRLIRFVRRGNPSCRLLVTGCYAELAPERIRSIEGVDRVFGNRDKPRIGEILDELGLVAGDEAPSDAPGAGADLGCESALELPETLHFGERSRAFLKVQEGCRLACSYCIIPRVRGASRSVPPEIVERTALALFRSGYRETVLTGVNTGDYGADLEPPTDLTALLRRLLGACGANRIRINSLEPRTVTDDVIGLMAADPRLAPHLQVPLQSGSAPILRAMRRNYDLPTYLQRLERVREAVPHACLGADVIVGFPGETDALFAEAYEFIAASPLNYLHVFSWSPRPGTPASNLPGRVRPELIRERSARLRGLGRELSLRFRKGFEGRVLDAVALGPDREGRDRVLTGNYIDVRLEKTPHRPASPVQGPTPREVVGVRVVRATPEETLGVLDDPPGWSRA
jgi:threonylcarbamoyladenosine tRNA methylthiotransferase MtaB